MSDRPDQSAAAGEFIEREWTDEFGTHYQAKIIRADGTIISQIVSRDRYSGWPKEREKAAANVRRAAAQLSDRSGQSAAS